MFKIISLIMYSNDDREYLYTFKEGINYFKGKNNSGKTEFYKFLDFMLGSSEDIRTKPWYSDSLEKVTMTFKYNGVGYSVSRTQNPNVNFFRYSNDQTEESIDLRSYKERLNIIFARDEENLKHLKSFTEEDLTFRAFTMFNFLGEKRQGSTQDFFDKCNDIKYSVKLTPILNYIFSSHLEEIYNLQSELVILTDAIKGLEREKAKHDFICNQVNEQLQKIGTKIWYTGKNTLEIRSYINELKNMISQTVNRNNKSISELEVMYSNISEQIKVYENRFSDTKRLEKSNINRKILLEKLEGMIDENHNFTHLVSPLKKIISELDSTISFTKYLTGDQTIKELKKQQNLLKIEIKRNDARFTIFEMEEKTRAIALIEEYTTVDLKAYDEELKEKKARIREIKGRLKNLQNLDDNLKIINFSKGITKLYLSAKENSSLVKEDSEQEGFEIKYIKKGNILQPTIVQSIDNEKNESKRVNYYVGSMARHTLIQLCGYLAFLNLLISENKYPLVPLLVIDHISKPFDPDNARAIGKALNTSLESIEKENLQIFMFDDKDPAALSIEPDHFENLVNVDKTGFNPFFSPQS